MQPKNVVLVFPPPWAPYQPYGSIAYLAGALNAAGINCHCLDASLEFYEHYLQPTVLLDCLQRARSARAGKGEDRRNYVDPELFAEHVIANAGEPQRILRGDEFYDPAKRVFSMRILRHALSVVSSAFAGCRLGIDFAKGDWNERCSRDLIDAVLSPPPNPFEEFYRARILATVASQQAAVLGVSIVFPDQAFPALLLCRMIRDECPHARIVVGGPFITANHDSFVAEDHPIYEIVDHVAIGEGESSLVELCQSVCNEQSTAHATMPRMITGRREDLNNSPTPAYELMPLARYFSPEPVLTLITSRGCYWNQCEFCDIPGIGQSAFMRKAPADVVADHMDTIHTETGTRCFALWDDAVPPATLKNLSNELLARDRHYYWYAQTRADPAYKQNDCETMYRAGCRQLYFGIETGSPRLAALMRKGVELEDVRSVVAMFSKAGIVVSGGYFFGYPGETKDDIEATLRFMLDNQETLYPSTRNVGAFSLRKGSPLHRRVAEVAIQVTEPKRNDLALDLEYVASDGTHANRKELALRVCQFLEELGFDEDRFGPHYLLYQMETGASGPTFEPQADDGFSTSRHALSSAVRWNIIESGNSRRPPQVLVYSPTSAGLVRLSREWIRWLRKDSEARMSPREDDHFQSFLDEQHRALRRKLLKKGILQSQCVTNQNASPLPTGVAGLSLVTEEK